MLHPSVNSRFYFTEMIRKVRSRLNNSNHPHGNDPKAHIKIKSSGLFHCQEGCMPCKPVLRIRITFMRIRILLFTLTRIQILTYPLMRIWILPFNLMRNQILPFTFFQFRPSNALMLQGFHLSLQCGSESCFSLRCGSGCGSSFTK